ncbi:sphingomyelin phosphodiesterase [Rhizorhabdus histidinilytica]|uniref:sphingomyelin phosphodiesterase n=1 Tax=Rhizorhabdus histidinilytica TaxID=439228 RepID=UPI001F223CCB|nr:sphingomyelin phosphodiesterase [Rhizorhabdus histidinilytica]
MALETERMAMTIGSKAGKMAARVVAGLGLIVLVLLVPGLLRPANGNTPFVMTNMRGHPGLSVMTYNIEGLPWPVRLGREAAFAKIGARLEALRLLGEQPHIVVLQEAFTDQAKRIGVEGGYRYIVNGPARSLAGAPITTEADRAFQREASFFSGERSGKIVDSGLQILSDYPILSVRRMAFPTCAGFDCLANKGAVLAMISVPGLGEPIAVVDVHLNSRRASHVADDRSLYAYRRQIDALDQFLAANVKPGAPVIVAGDFNVGQRPARRAYFAAHLRKWGERAPGIVRDALRTCSASETVCGSMPTDAAYSMLRARDWQLAVPGARLQLAVQGLSTPFGHDADGAMLSDHVGYVAFYGAKRS